MTPDEKARNALRAWRGGSNSGDSPLDTLVLSACRESADAARTATIRECAELARKKSKRAQERAAGPFDPFYWDGISMSDFANELDALAAKPRQTQAF